MSSEYRTFEIPSHTVAIVYDHILGDFELASSIWVGGVPINGLLQEEKFVSSTWEICSGS